MIKFVSFLELVIRANLVLSQREIPVQVSEKT